MTGLCRKESWGEEKEAQDLGGRGLGQEEVERNVPEGVTGTERDLSLVSLEPDTLQVPHLLPNMKVMSMASHLACTWGV